MIPVQPTLLYRFKSNKIALKVYAIIHKKIWDYNNLEYFLNFQKTLPIFINFSAISTSVTLQPSNYIYFH